MAVTLLVTFERLAEALDEARGLPRQEAFHLLRDAVDTIEPDSDLRVWFLRRAVQVLEQNEDGA